MSRFKRNPALVISILALVAAIVVPAYALTRDEKRVVRNIAKFQANKQITERAPGLSVKNAETTDEDEVVSNRLVLKDPIAGDAPGHAFPLLNAGPITIVATCYDDWAVGGQPGNDVADLHLDIFDVPSASWSGIKFGDPIEPIAGNAFANTGSSPFLSAVWPAASEPEGDATETVQVTLFADNGQVMNISARAEVNIAPKDPEDPSNGEREGCRFFAAAVGLGS